MLGDNDQDALRGAVLPAEGIEIFFVAGLGSPEGVLRFGDTVIVGIRSEDGHVVGVCGIAAYIEIGSIVLSDVYVVFIECLIQANANIDIRGLL